MAETQFTFCLRQKHHGDTETDRVRVKKKRKKERLKEKEAGDAKKIKKILLRVKRWRGGHGKREEGWEGRKWGRASTNEECSR